MTSTDASTIETIGYLGCGNNRLSRLEVLQQQHQQFHQGTSSPCEHECMHHHHHHSSNFSSSSNVVPNGPYTHHHNHFNHLNQHMHPNSYISHHHQTNQQQPSQQQQQQDGNLIYNNSSTNSECNQPVSPTNDSSQSGCSNMIHYVPTSNISMASQTLNIPNVSCECPGHVQHHHHQRQSSEQHSLQSGRSSRIISCDENNPSGTEDGSGMSSSGMITSTCRASKRHLNNLDNQQRLCSPKRSGTSSLNNETEVKGNQDDIKYSNAMDRMDIYSDSTENAIKIGDDTTDDDRPPRLPPRPPPRPRNTMNSETVPHPPGVRKYVIWCLICGGILCLIGVMFLAVYFLLRSYTSTVGYFETVPPFVPATLLLLTGLCIISLARRRNRYSYLIKLSGACSLASALTCALVTVTTTVIHMSRLQALKECQYTQKTRTCTCSSTLSESDDLDDSSGVRFVFDATTDCSVVHGALYSCLRAVFGLSVAGVFVAVFSCMLVYQLLSHERKKMYWEQLELRCRSLYSGPPLPPPGPAIIGTPRGGPCRCCEQCHAHRAAIPYTWDADSRFWAAQSGNFYSPNPGDEGNRIGTTGGNNQRNRSWNWPRMPWQRNVDPSSQNPQSQPPTTSPTGQRFHQPISSSDSQYGFSNGAAPDNGSVSQQNGYSVIGPYGVWGPPPPYSDPNSPARRGRYQYIHPNMCHQNIIEQHISPNQPILDCHQQHSSSATDSHSEQFCTQANVQNQQPIQQPQQQQQQPQRNPIKRQAQFKSKENYENTPSDSDGGPRDRFSNTLPTRKTKKRADVIAANKSIGPNNPQQRANVQNVFNNLQADSTNQSEVSENEYNEPTHPSTEASSMNPTPQHVKLNNNINNNNNNSSNNSSSSSSNNNNIINPSNNANNVRRAKLGIENTGFQPIDVLEQAEINGESEVYFADVSSCCNISVKNDNYYEDANQRRIPNVDKADADEYLSQRFGNREPSTRSRLPFPQMVSEDFEKTGNKQMNTNNNSNNNGQPPAIPAPRTSIMQKDISRQTTPTATFQSYPVNNKQPAVDGYQHQQENFVASFPYNEQSQEAHRRSTKNLQDIFLSADAQYETIKDSNQYETTPLTLNYELNHDISSSSISSSSYSNNKSSPIHYTHGSTPTITTASTTKSTNATPIKRQNLGTNISAIIQNLSGNDISLLYPENTNNGTNMTPSPHHKQKQDCNDVINSNIVVNSEKQKEWSEINGNDRRM
ncbi:transcription factor mef2A isoform X2 [Chironomus tepperi]|uniref:transcription factor mef2A isoform X2 n=1 Tax=Chironomus tepperi TaxID=113505 RepID=UPI00391EFB9E